MGPLASRFGLDRYARLLCLYLRPRWRQVLLLGALLAAGTALQLANPQILRAFIDSARAGGALGELTRDGAAFLAVALARQVVGVVTGYVGEDLGWAATNALRVDLFRHCMRLDLSFHRRHRPGELIERVDGDVTALANFFSQFFLLLIGNGLLLVGILVLLFREDWRIGTALSLVSAVALLVVTRLRTVAVPSWAARRQADAELWGFLEERLAGTEDIRAGGAVDFVLRGLYLHLRDRLAATVRAVLTGVLAINATVATFVAANAAGLGVGIYLYARGAVTLGTVYMVYAYTDLLRTPLALIANQLQDFQVAAASVGRVEALAGLASAVPDGPGEPLPAGPLAVEFEQVSFRYGDEGDDTALAGVSFQLAPGQTLGVVGRTGGGKTTMTRLLFRLYDPTNGCVRLGGVDLRGLRLSDLRQRVGLVTQDVQLFRASVRDNLTFFRPEIADDQIRQALDALDLGGWYASLPAGLDTELAGSASVSAGEAQLLALARAFLKDPGLVILDEASSRLDPATERLIERAIDVLLRGRTAIIVAHRLATLRRADEILVIEDGRVAEHGPRKQLDADPASQFHRLRATGRGTVLA